MHYELLIIKPVLVRWAKVYVFFAVSYFGIALNATVLPEKSEIRFSHSAIASTQPVSAESNASINNSTQASSTSPATSTSAVTEPGPKPPPQSPPPPQPNVPPTVKSSNTYWRGQCTWYAKDRRPDLPNNLGHANTWVARARAQGIPTGTEPKPGAIGQQGMHVVYVEKVNGDGTIIISEMNYIGAGIINSRKAAAGSFQYIY